MNAPHFLFKVSIATVLVSMSLATSTYAADIIQQSMRTETRATTHTVRSSYVSEECELLQITYREPKQTEIVKICYPPIF
jgi:hypothetical protein